MLPAALSMNNDQHRLRNLLAFMFLALAVPTTAIIWQAYGQLKWESFYQYRAQAEALSNRIDSAITTQMMVADDRNFADFAFLNVAKSGAVLQVSPLAAFPVVQDLPGVIGYFQVGSDGSFSTPLIPDDGTNYTAAGLDAADFNARTTLANEIRQILAQNKLVSDRAPAEMHLPLPSAPVDQATDSVSSMLSAEFESSDTSDKDDRVDELAGFARDADAPGRGQVAEKEPAYTHDVFTSLNTAPALSIPTAATVVEVAEEAKRENSRGRLQDLVVNDELLRKSAEIDQENAQLEGLKQRKDMKQQDRSRRTEQVAMREEKVVQQGAGEARENDTANDIDATSITTFASDIDPYEFSLLNSGHVVMFRNVWRNGERFVQGFLIDQTRFTESAIASAFRETTLAGMSDLFVGFQDDIISTVRGAGGRRYSSSGGALEGTLLFRRALSAPFDRLELVFSINQLPRGPGAGVLMWSTVVIAAVFLAGFIALYRLGMSQIRLARQQQDFVSAVSHELKTPLTSIRMYGEMLKEGWADENKQQQYYEYIHDESERLTRLISNVLQLAKITRSDPEFDLQAVTVGELMSQIESKIVSQVERAGFDLAIERDADSDQASLSIDGDCFAQIVINLVDNAIKFSRDANDKAIRISANVTNDRRVTFSVRDFGPGIPKDQLQKIFKLFYRTESELTRETVGTGIGLAIVHQLVTVMKGRIDVINREPGAQFNVSFPLD